MSTKFSAGRDFARHITWLNMDYLYWIIFLGLMVVLSQAISRLLLSRYFAQDDDNDDGDDGESGLCNPPGAYRTELRGYEGTWILNEGASRRYVNQAISAGSTWVK
ncbi:hypothetical protein F9C07_9534 [Aspergillus flavus]|uniref:Uncharacterized protein n=1 Tax=Aspergillus flavus (strain ATCC 200026 / FGSC A1120 / IAM 13836 / NRRL 3357 / JCM 12722 / SRRC 167) TaxID=332952 RepID=A0A7U2MCS2_ASPFN|nr:hypothetical protein F9C07_9534 [Aspergillus flavus]